MKDDNDARDTDDDDDVTGRATFLVTAATRAEEMDACALHVARGVGRPKCARACCDAPCADGYETSSYPLCDGCHAEADEILGPMVRLRWS